MPGAGGGGGTRAGGPQHDHASALGAAETHLDPFSRLQRVDNYEYELPEDFEDEEIDEDTAFTGANSWAARCR